MGTSLVNEDSAYDMLFKVRSTSKTMISDKRSYDISTKDVSLTDRDVGLLRLSTGLYFHPICSSSTLIGSLMSVPQNDLMFCVWILTGGLMPVLQNDPVLDV